jgi:hypothetical protein
MFLYDVTLWDPYTLSNEIKTLLIIINHKRHLTMCIMTPKQYRYNVRYKYLDLRRRQSSWTHFMSHDIQNGAKYKRVIFALHSLSRGAQFGYHCSHQQTRGTSVFLIRTSSSYKKIHRDRICMATSHEQRWIISINTNYLYKKNTHLIHKN